MQLHAMANGFEHAPQAFDRCGRNASGVHAAGDQVAAFPLPQIGRMGVNLITADTGVQALGMNACVIGQQPGGGDGGAGCRRPAA